MVDDPNGADNGSLNKSEASGHNTTEDANHTSATARDLESNNYNNDLDATTSIPTQQATDDGTNGITEESRQATRTEQQRRRSNGQVEERKRSRRLFGALIGTLSQTSTKSTAAQRRRADIEQKQQTKLKLQAEELDQERLKRLEAVMRVRRREQRKFDDQSVCVPRGIAHFSTPSISKFASNTDVSVFLFNRIDAHSTFQPASNGQLPSDDDGAATRKYLNSSNLKVALLGRISADIYAVL